MKPTIQGALAAIIIFLIIGGATATFYAFENITLNGSRITSLPVQWGSGGSAPASLDAITKGYAIENRKVICTYYAVNTTYCNNVNCYANKLTADKVCSVKQMNTYSSSYYFNYQGVLSASKWSSIGWGAVGPDVEDLGSGGGSMSVNNTGTGKSAITGVYCCG